MPFFFLVWLDLGLNPGLPDQQYLKPFSCEQKIWALAQARLIMLSTKWIYKYIYIYIYMYIYIYIYIYSPTPVWLSSLANEVIVLALAFICKALHIWIELSVAVYRMYVNNSNCDSEPFKIYFAATGSSWLKCRVSDWRLSQPSFAPNYGKLVCLATLMSSDRTKQICLWMTIYIYIYENGILH